MDVSEFVLARIAEDEATASGVADPEWSGADFGIRFESWESDHTKGDTAFVNRFNPDRIKTECRSKRRIIDNLLRAAQHEPDDEYGPATEAYIDTLEMLAGSWLNHPDYDPSWRL